MFYDRFVALCEKKGVSENKACADSGISRSVAAKWKNQLNSGKDVKPSAKTKSRKKSAIVYPEILRPVVESLLKSKGEKLLSINKDNFYIEFYDCLERAKVRKLPPYSCRHTYGTEAVKLGVHPAVVQKMLRHSNQRTQERYTHLTSEEAHEAVNLFARG